MERESRVRGLDTLRFALACCVAIGHNGLFPLFEGIDTSSQVGWFVNGTYNASVNGPAAVMVFFVISGFCIHYPYRNGGSVRLLEYYPRRYLRILLPLGMAIGVVHLAGVEMPLFGESILWSIICEEIYYLIYPIALLPLWRRVGARWMLGVAFAAAAVVAWTDPTAKNFPSFGWHLNWVLGLPCWLLGCQLAEKSDTLHAPVSCRAIWAWRFGVWIVACLCLGLRFHSPVGFPHTLNYFGIVAYFWLRQEIRYFRTVPPLRILEWAGQWSYSLYLIHVPANVTFLQFPIISFGFLVDWLLRYAWTLGCCYGFYRLVEKPSHRFARWAGSHMAAQRRRDSEPTARAIENVAP